MKYQAKVVDLGELAELMAAKREQGCTTALDHGCFDILQLGNVHYLAQAELLCSSLAVTATPDHFARKSPHRPVFTSDQRMEVLAALSMVDTVALNHWATAKQTLLFLTSNIYVKGRNTMVPVQTRQQPYPRESLRVLALEG